MRDTPKRPSREEIEELLECGVDPVIGGPRTYFYTDLENDDIPPTFREEDKRYFCKLLLERLGPHPC